MKTVCDVLGMARSNVVERANRSAQWSDGRRARRPMEDDVVVSEIRAEIAQLPTYGSGGPANGFAGAAWPRVSPR